MGLGRAALVVVGLIGALAVGAAAAVPPYDPMRIYPTEEAFARSIKVYQDALAANPRDAEAAYWLGDAYWEASLFYRHDSIPYGADYLDRSIASLEQTVGIDDKHLAAWALLVAAYQTRDGRGDEDKRWAAVQKVVALSHDPSVINRGLPPTRKRGGEIPVTYVTLPDLSAKSSPADLLVVGDADTMRLYRYPCPALPAITRPAFFLSKWEAYDWGYRPAEACVPL